jgi:hypothetical protein
LTDSIIETKLYVDNVQNMDALFIELPVFQKHRDDYLDDDLFRSFQLALLKIRKRVISSRAQAGCVKFALVTNEEEKVSAADYE